MFERKIASLKQLFFAANGEISQNLLYWAPSDPGSDSLTVAQAWEGKGTYVFLGESIFDWPTLADDIQSYVGANAGTRFLWIENPSDSENSWRVARIPAGDPTGDHAPVSARTLISFRNYALILEQGATVTSNADGSFALTSASGQQISLSANAGRDSLAVVEEPVTIPAYGQDGAGALCCELAVDAAQMASLGIGLRYFYGGPSPLTSLSYPVFQPASPCRLYASFDAAAPTDISRTFIAFNKKGCSTITPIASCFRTTAGNVVALAAPSDSAKLVFAVDAQSNPAGSSDPYYLVPCGEFQVSVEADSAAKGRLMCGLSGIEYLATSTGQGTPLMRFIPGKPAYAPQFSGANPNGTKPNELLSDVAETAWIYLLVPELVYWAQPDNASLHHPSDPLAPFFEVLPVPSGTLPQVTAGAGDDSVSYALPMVPYGGVVASGDQATTYMAFERQVLSQVRRAQVFAIDQQHSSVARGLANGSVARGLANVVEPGPSTPTPDPSKTRLGATPQGLLAEFSEDLSIWKQLTLGRSGDQRLALTDIDGVLEAALQSNQQFLVFSNPDSAIGTSFTQNQITIAGWTFDLGPKTWADRSTILIFKFFAGKSVEDLVADISLWGHADTFNVDPTGVQTELTSIIAAAKQMTTGPTPDPHYQHFVDVVTAQTWNGIIALNVAVPLSGLPAQLEGLAAGIDPSKFAAHHLGIDISPVHLTPLGKPKGGQTSFFGLIDYEDAQTAPPLAPYGFHVDQLLAQLESSKINSFASKLSVTLNQLFGEPTVLQKGNSFDCSKQPTPQPGQSNAVQLLGTYESHDGRAAYSFTTPKDSDSLFAVQSEILCSVEITGGRFGTVVPPSGQADDTIHSRFVFGGKIAFRTLQDTFDLFSYDALVFENLAIDMSFPTADPTALDMSFDASGIGFSREASVAREGSLAAQFPLAPRGLQVGDKPADGYLPIIMNPAPKQLAAQLREPWFGIECDLQLGSVGALGSKKSFTAGVLLAWTPAQGPFDGNQVQLGIRLPFTGGKKQIDIEGVLSLGIAGVWLQQSGDDYLLVLKQFGLRVLGAVIPPGGDTDLYLFGNPKAKQANSLAWYGAYVKKQA